MFICLLMLARSVYAISVTSFSAGSPISASLMNANFSNVVSAVNTLPWSVSGGLLSTTYTATGINNASPVGTLDIGTSNANCNLTTTGSIGVPALRISNNYVYAQSFVDFYASGTLRGRIRSDYPGNMYVFARGGVVQLQVGGEADFSSSVYALTLNTNGVLSHSNGWNISTAGGLSGSSDARMKEDVQPIPHALSKLLQVRGVEFKWKQGAPDAGKRSLGVIAQEVEKVFPELVGEGEKGKTVAYAQLIAPMIEAMRELAAQDSEKSLQITELITQVKELSLQVKELKEQHLALRK